MAHDDCCSPRSRAGWPRRHVIAGALGAAVAAKALAAEPSSAQARSERLATFDMRDVDLLDSPFLHAQRRTEAYLLSLDPDRLASAFRTNAGLEPKAPPYGGWESEAIWADINCHGHTLGHYLSACALMHRSTGDARFKQRVDYLAEELAACQAASNSGLVCAFPKGPAPVEAHIRGEKITGVPWYTLHKVFAGLRDGAQLADSDASRAVLLRLADWTVAATAPLSDVQFETMLETEHGGMNEVFADLFAMTGETRYRTMAERFSHKALLTPLARGRDTLDGLHANTQIPKVIGFRRVHEVTGQAAYDDAATFFWKTVARTRSFATGGVGDGEHFFPMAEFDKHVFSAKGSETCCQHNMLKLTRALFLADPNAEYADYYERSLYNGILASQDPASGMVTYFQGARPGYMKLYCTPTDSFWCCTGTGMENHAKYRDSIYFHDRDALYVNLFIPSRVAWREQGATLTQTTAFPEAATTSLAWSLERPTPLTLKLRHPGWSPSATVLVNGKIALRSQSPGRFLEIARTWNDGDKVELRLEMRTGFETGSGARDVAAFTYGPLVLAGALGSEGLPPGADIVVNERLYGKYNDGPFTPPKLAGDPASVAARIRPSGKPLEFTVTSAEGRAVRLVPYHRIAHQRYATYWRVQS